jgi:Asp-tRNA(Asn)/Glu-tRNA(Gln) amidotransferase A subunit family amidase
MNDLNFLSAVEMAVQIRARAISPVELLDAHLARIAELNVHRDPKLNAFVHVNVDGAREQAKIA